MSRSFAAGGTATRGGARVGGRPTAIGRGLNTHLRRVRTLGRQAWDALARLSDRGRSARGRRVLRRLRRAGVRPVAVSGGTGKAASAPPEHRRRIFPPHNEVTHNLFEALVLADRPAGRPGCPPSSYSLQIRAVRRESTGLRSTARVSALARGATLSVVRLMADGCGTRARASWRAGSRQHRGRAYADGGGGSRSLPRRRPLPAARTHTAVPDTSQEPARDQIVHTTPPAGPPQSTRLLQRNNPDHQRSTTNTTER